jgi:hypothetical protein
MGPMAIQEGESLNDSFGFERSLWRRKAGQGECVSIAVKY